MCADLTCPSWQATCEGESPTRRCVYRTWMCDGTNDCGNNWDEEPDTCGLVATRNCMIALEEQCSLSVSTEEMWDKIVNTSFRETCGPVMTVQECATTVLSSSPNCDFSQLKDHPRVVQLQRMINAANITVNYICRDHVQVFDKHKECLLSRDEDKFVIVETVQQTCHPTAASFCMSLAELTCINNVVREQCGDDITDHLLLLRNEVEAEIGCDSDTGKRYWMTKKEIWSPLKLIHK